VRLSRLQIAALAAIPVAFIGALFVYPVLSILATGLSQTDGYQGFTELFSNPGIRRAAWFTLWQASISTVATLAIGLPAAHLFGTREFAGRRLFLSLITVPFILPTVVVAAAFSALTDGWFQWDAPVLTIIIAHVFFNYSVVVRTVAAAWANLDPSLEEAAATLGASSSKILRTVTLPRLRGPIAAAAAIVFLFTFTSFGVVLILGRGAIRTLEVEMYTQTVQFLNLPLGAALAIAQLVFVIAALWLYSRYRRVPSPLAVTRHRQEAKPSEFVPNLFVMVLLLGIPVLALVERSLRVGDGYGLSHFRRLFEADSPLPAIGNSLTFALVALAIAVITGALAAALVAYSRGKVARGFDTLLMLPLGTSAVTIGFGFLVALDWPVDLRTSWFLVPIAHSLVALPLVVRTVAPAMSAIPERLRESSIVLGAGPWETWRRVDFPLVWRSWVVAAGFAFAVSVGEFGATSFIARPATTTMPTLIFRLLGRAGEANYGAAMAMSVVLMVVTGASILIIDRMRSTGVGEF